MIAFLDFEIFGKRLTGFAETHAAFFEADLFAGTLRAGLAALRAGRVLRSADFFAELFFFFGLAIRMKGTFYWGARKNGGLIKNIWPSAQAEIWAKDGELFFADFVDLTS